MSTCHICGKSGPYTEMIDYTAYSAHPKCKYKLKHIIQRERIPNCSICKKIDVLSKGEQEVT